MHWRILAPLVAALSCCAQDNPSSVSLSNGITVAIAHSSTVLKVSMEPASGNSFYRIFRDENNLAVFAYELQVDRTPDGQVRVLAKPAGSEFAAKFPNADGGKPTPTLSQTLESPALGDGGEFTVPIPTQPGLDENLTDTIQVQISAPAAAVSGTALQNGQLRFRSLRVYINNKLASPPGPGATVQGRYVMFYLPGRGAYFFSAAPVNDARFAQIGAVDGPSLQFMLSNENFLCKSDAPILANAATGQIWAYHDPNYKPTGNWTNTEPNDGSQIEFFAAGSNSLSWWLR